MKSGIGRMSLGLLILIVGGGVTLATYYDAASGGGKYTVAWGAMAVGAWMAITGLLQAAREKRSGGSATAAPEQRVALTGIDAMMRCMAFIAAADGKVEDSERAVFAEIVERLTGRKLSGDELRYALDKAGEEFFDPISFFQEHGEAFDQDFRRLILKAGCFIAMADGSVAQSEAERLRVLGQGLKIPRAECDAIIAGLQAQTTPGSQASTTGSH